MPYLTQVDYLDRFGEAETIRLTDESKAGVVDEDKLATAISDAEELVDGYLAGRYPIPLASAPGNIKGIVADLARERLHKARPLPAVTEAADRARSLLRDISAGRMVLLVDQEPADPLASGFAQSAPTQLGYVFNADKLSRF